MIGGWSSQDASLSERSPVSVSFSQARFYFSAAVEPVERFFRRANSVGNGRDAVLNRPDQQQKVALVWSFILSYMDETSNGESTLVPGYRGDPLEAVWKLFTHFQVEISREALCPGFPPKSRRIAVASRTRGRWAWGREAKEEQEEQS